MDITNSIGIENAKEHLTTYYCQFLEDIEPEVRTAAVRRLSDFALILDNNVILTSIIPSLNKLKTD
jgi:hypothetical protein